MGQAVINRLKRRIADLEEAIEPLVPLAMCDTFDVSLVGQIRRGSKDAIKRLEEYRRQSMYMDMGIFKRLEELMRNRG